LIENYLITSGLARLSHKLRSREMEGKPDYAQGPRLKALFVGIEAIDTKNWALARKTPPLALYQRVVLESSG
jgi:hypothetical protein